MGVSATLPAHFAVDSYSMSFIGRRVMRSLAVPMWRRGELVASRGVSSGSADSSMPSAATVAAWSVDAVADFAKNSIGLHPNDVEIMKKRRVSGKALLGLDEAKMERAGFSFEAIATLQPVRTLLLGGE